MTELPEDIVEYIISFACDRRGYNSIEYEKRKRKSYDKMIRIGKEIKYWKYLHVNVCWLKGTSTQSLKYNKFNSGLKKGKPDITYHIGCYRSYDDERRINHSLVVNKLI